MDALERARHRRLGRAPARGRARDDAADARAGTTGASAILWAVGARTTPTRSSSSATGSLVPGRARTCSRRSPATCGRPATPSTARSPSTCCASRTASSPRSPPSSAPPRWSRRRGGGVGDRPLRRVRTAADALMTLDPGFRRWEVALPPGGERAYDEAEWHDALVVVECGEIELESMPGELRSLRGGIRALLNWIGASPDPKPRARAHRAGRLLSRRKQKRRNPHLAFVYRVKDADR